MSDGMSSVSCLSVTTLVIVSLANLILLIVMIMESRKRCNDDALDLTDTFRFGALGTSSKYSSLVNAKNQRDEPKFMAALTLIKGNTFVLICGTTIISKFWILTAAHCCETVKMYPFERLKISSNAENWKKGKKHSVETLARHVNYTAKSVTHDVCLIKVGSPFKERFEVPVALASSRYQYVQDTSATTLGWSSKKDHTSDNLYFINVNLISFQRCRALVKNERVDPTMVCAYNIGNVDCRFDSGGPLVQNNVVIGIVSYETNCVKRSGLRVFTRISYFERWFQQVEKQNGVRIGVVFKP